MAPTLPPSPVRESEAIESGLPSFGTAAPKPMSFGKLMSISIGFLGIQFAWAIQMGQMGPLLERLGSDPLYLLLIQLAGPVTGIAVQPIIGALSDNSRSSFGRRRPFLLAGALLTALSLILMPNSPNLLVAAVLLWVLDASINLTQGPYRALVPDVVPRTQQATTYSLMSLTIGLGSVAAFGIAYYSQQIHAWFVNLLSGVPTLATIPAMNFLFYLGASAMLLAMGWTIASTREPKLPSIPNPLDKNGSSQKSVGFIADTLQTIANMPLEAKKLCLAHSFTWFGLAFLFSCFAVYVPHNIFGALKPGDVGYQQGVDWANLCYAALNMVCFLFSAVSTKLCQVVSKKALHTFGLLCMAGSLISMHFIHSPEMVMVAMGLLGVGWATTLSIPFALLSEHVPAGKEGVLMGTFNVFIAAPQSLALVLGGPLVMAFGNDYSVALVAGGSAMIVSALLLQWVKEGVAPRTLQSV